MILTNDMLLKEGYQTNGRLSHAFYLLADGTTWDGDFQDGCRCNDHREVEAFTTLDRYDDGFWEHVTVNMGLILIVPECKEIQVNPNWQPTAEQKTVIRLLKRRMYEIREFK